MHAHERAMATRRIVQCTRARACDATRRMVQRTHTTVRCDAQDRAMRRMHEPMRRMHELMRIDRARMSIDEAPVSIAACSSSVR